MPPDSSGLVRASPGQVLGSVTGWFSPFTKLISGFLAVSLPLCSLVCGEDLLPATLLLWMQHPQEQGFSQPKLRLPNKRSHWCAIHSILNLYKESLFQNSHCAFENVFLLVSMETPSWLLCDHCLVLMICWHRLGVFKAISIRTSCGLNSLPPWSKLPYKSFY